ncbi:MAG TPA: class I SAM-dependent methyltransferase [Vicinamibacterales bacterium]|nr:class I SAM-dependent methyltransferase [Vicinamibacterales bacterium]
MTTGSQRTAEGGRDHYSYAHYASRDVAEGFDALRFGGPVGRHLLETQEALLLDVLSPLEGRRVLDVGAGTGRVALGLAARGAIVHGLDASAEMLAVARERAAEAGLAIQLDVADAHALPVADRSVDAAVCFRLLMHVLDWRRCVAEICRVSRQRVVIDFPAAASAAAIESLARRARQAMGQRVEAYRVMRERDVREALAANGFRVVLVRRQFVLPIALHKAIGRLPVSLAVERGLAAVGLLRALGSPVTMVAER